ncbi:copper chaperone PCu(A)C [Marinobacter apostichopi]|uniref:copper chaperone PCu(A)C n=1 Tax=Marinobacter apostichopi TaxID=3035454 RepID=UPI0025737291|nr:copper chaperone PCu(A)C [Marinobacter sp. LA51]
MKVKALLAAALIALTPAWAAAHEFVSEAVHIDHPWSRPTPPGTPMGVGYLVIKNISDADITLVGAQTPRAASVSIHESMMNDGMMSMQPLKNGLTIPSGETVELKPHGYHLMLEKLNGSLQEGESIPLTLKFIGTGSMDVELKVMSLDGDAMKMEMDHAGHDMKQ